MRKLWKDLFYGPGNKHLDLGRIVGAVGVGMMLGGEVWNAYCGKPIDLGPGGLGGGLAAVIGAVAVLIAAKDHSQKKAAAPPVK